MTRNLTLIKSLAVAGVAGLLLAGCGAGEDNPPSGNDNGGDSATGESAAGSSFSVMESWEGCEALDDIQAIQDYMGVVDLGSSGLVTSKIGAGLDGEAFTCGAMANIAPYTNDSGREFPGDANITVGGVPWNSEDEAATNFQTRLGMLADSIETGGTEYSNVKEGELSGDWDESYLYTAQTEVGYQINAIGRKGDLIVYTFIDYTNDPGVQFDAEPTYPFTSEELNDWVANDYMSQALADLLAKKESGL